MKKPAEITSKSLLLASGIALASLAPVSASLAASGGADINIDSSGINVVPGTDCSFMSVRIMNPDSVMVFNYDSPVCATTDWSLSAQTADGTYRMEVVVVDSSESSTRQSFSFNIVNNEIIIPDDDKKSINFDSAKNQYSNPQEQQTTGIWQTVSNTLLSGFAGALEWMVPSAQAETFASVLLQSSFPDLQYDDTGRGGSNWSLNAFEDGPNNSVYFILTDLTTGLDAFQFTPGSNGTSTFITDDNGDINFANDAFFVDRGADFVGIGTDLPEVNLQINDLAPTIRFDDENEVTNAEITFDNGDLTVTPGGAMNVVFTGVNDAGDGLTKLADLQANNTSGVVGKGSDAGFSMFNVKQNSRWNFRTLGQNFAATKEGTGGAEMRVINGTNDFTNVSILMGNGAQLTSGGVWQNASSKTFKENIEEITGTEAMQALKSIQPVKYHYKKDKSRELNLGFIAEDVPELVSTPNRKNMDPMEVVAMLTKVVQEQQDMLEKQQQIINELQQETVAIKKEVRLQNMVSALSHE